MTLKDIQNKLYENLKESGWGDKLKMFILSQEFSTILETLYEDSQNGKKFTPVLKDLFRAFQECPYNELKAVIIGQSPYPQAGEADGMAFSCSHTGKAQPQLSCMLKEINNTVSESESSDPDLTRWANQGVLLLNSSLTSGIGGINSHEELWKPFTAFLLDMLCTNNSKIVYVFLGAETKEWHKSISNMNYKFFASHPISGTYRKDKKWDSGNLFNQINNVLEKEFNTPIKW
jgi:uracil-DNA glycosylase